MISYTEICTNLTNWMMGNFFRIFGTSENLLVGKYQEKTFKITE